jgi:hypothetical protein
MSRATPSKDAVSLFFSVVFFVSILSLVLLGISWIRLA